MEWPCWTVDDCTKDTFSHFQKSITHTEQSTKSGPEKSCVKDKDTVIALNQTEPERGLKLRRRCVRPHGHWLQCSGTMYSFFTLDYNMRCTLCAMYATNARLITCSIVNKWSVIVWRSLRILDGVRSGISHIVAYIAHRLPFNRRLRATPLLTADQRSPCILDPAVVEKGDGSIKECQTRTCVTATATTLVLCQRLTHMIQCFFLIVVRMVRLCPDLTVRMWFRRLPVRTVETDTLTTLCRVRQPLGLVE